MPLGLQTNFLDLIDQAVSALDTACSSPATYSQVQRLTTLLTTLTYYHHTARKAVPRSPLQQTAAERPRICVGSHSFNTRIDRPS